MVKMVWVCWFRVVVDGEVECRLMLRQSLPIGSLTDAMSHHDETTSREKRRSKPKQGLRRRKGTNKKKSIREGGMIVSAEETGSTQQRTKQARKRVRDRRHSISSYRHPMRTLVDLLCDGRLRESGCMRGGALCSRVLCCVRRLLTCTDECGDDITCIGCNRRHLCERAEDGEDEEEKIDLGGHAE